MNDNPIFSMLTGKGTGYIVSNAGTTGYNDTYCEAGTLNGKKYYANSNNTLFIFWDSFDGGMWSISNSFDVANVPPGYYKYSNDNTPPLSNYLQAGATPPNPSLTATTCA
jgi:hypothetical protein